MPLLLSFVSMFGVGGLFATQMLDLHGGQAALVGTIFGLIGMAIAYGPCSRSCSGPRHDEPFSIGDLVGDDAYVAVGIPAGQLRQRARQEGRPDPRVQRDLQHGHRLGRHGPHLGHPGSGSSSNR